MEKLEPPDCKTHLLLNGARLFSSTEFKIEVVQFLPAGKGQPAYLGDKIIELNDFCVAH